jgi:type II secretory ATPase GspE/PulE/Tfp pilus assembly ATPase PilB-like protein
MVSLDPVVERIFDEAVLRKASDIHLEPEADELRLRWREAGVMQDGPLISGALKSGLISKLKVLARLDPTQNLVPQDGSFVINKIQVRMSAIPVVGGQSVVLRIFKQAEALERLSGLGLDKNQIGIFLESLKLRQGLVVIAGPTGSGKTTTFYAALREVNPAREKIITVEDPIEQRLEGVCQVPVTPRLPFSAALRSILRQAPNVIGVGELRDGDSARVALQAALTGHLVIATLHADSVAAVPARLIDIGLEPAILAEVLSCVVAQRLISSRGEDGVRRLHGIFEVTDVDDKLKAKIRARASSTEITGVLEDRNFTTLRMGAEKLMEEWKLTRESVIDEFGA